MFPRYKSMNGFHVSRRGGWDTHGLPVEIEVEKRLGFTNKQQIEDYGIAKFNELCRESVFTYIQEWEKLTDRIGYWVDLEDAYVTYKNAYIESVWWLLKSIWDRGLALSGLQGCALLPPLRYTAFRSRGRPGLRPGDGPFAVRYGCRWRMRRILHCWSGRRRPGRCPAMWRWQPILTSNMSR